MKMQAKKQIKKIELESLEINGEYFFKISNYDAMRPFFMSIVSDSNHWMFISSNGGLTAGRKDAEHALFPYYTDDKITELADTTGSKSIFHIQRNGTQHVWEPFSNRQQGQYQVSRNIYKSKYGNKIIFEEINHDLETSFTYEWCSSNLYGFVKKGKLSNHSKKELDITLLDGIQNILPSGVPNDLQNSTSNLVDAYKRNELEESSGLGLFALSAIIVDRAEPSEALKANVVWSLGLDNATHLLSSLQLNAFRKGHSLTQEVDIKAEKGAYFLSKSIQLSGESSQEWLIIANVNQTHSDIAQLIYDLKNNPNLKQEIEANIALGTRKLIQQNAASDGLQYTADRYLDSRHFSNTLFNIMRGGIFDRNYQIEKWDLINYLKHVNKKTLQDNQDALARLPETFTFFEMKKVVNEADDKDFKRLCIEYMPLKFSRRHGDPSRPWNKFSINTSSEIDGSKILDYEGNWRDIFQNWEALAQSFPSFTESMIHKFLNATTFDGYNPYRVTKIGYDWETIEPDNPWSYIGYWGDHQIIYLLKLLETSEKYYPGKLERYFTDERFVYANVPYKIKDYDEIIENPKDTIVFDEELDATIRAERLKNGADASLMFDENGNIYKVNYIEKVLATVLSKLSNFIPEGGIWMNTQRPEWNDANNALVGNGVSMVTLYYLRRFLTFFANQIENTEEERVSLSVELIVFYKSVRKIFESHQCMLEGKINDQDRKLIMDGLGSAGSEYRKHIYKQSFWGTKRTISFDGLRKFVNAVLKFVDHTIAANERSDKLYHAYNLINIKSEKEVSISYLDEMLEGQVAILSSGYLSSSQSLEVLNALKASVLFREDQYSYILYPNKDLKGFMFKNTIPETSWRQSKILSKLVETDDHSIVEKDINGEVHFNGRFRNAEDLKGALNELDFSHPSLSNREDKQRVFEIFEEVFNHRAFTGRSGTFFGYEGLGSIYWHMVSKLLLAVQEVCLKAEKEGENEELKGKLLEHYYEINASIGVHKSPELYGAFPTDPYSHTPAGKGAQQPGMTGQVKEDILSRFGELGVYVDDGCIHFKPYLLREKEFVTKNEEFNYFSIELEHKKITLEKGSLAFTFCQIPIVYRKEGDDTIELHHKNGEKSKLDGLRIDELTSNLIFERRSDIEQITVNINPSILK